MNGGSVEKDNNGRQGASNLYMYTLLGEKGGWYCKLLWGVFCVDG